MLLAERLAATGRPMGVLNAGINSNLLLHDLSCAGESGIARFRRDVLDQPGVRSVLVLEGINDILSSEFEYGSRSRSANHRRHSDPDATLLPMRGEWFYNERNEALRDAVNRWIRTSGEYDSVADFDALSPIRPIPTRCGSSSTPATTCIPTTPA